MILFAIALICEQIVKKKESQELLVFSTMSAPPLMYKKQRQRVKIYTYLSPSPVLFHCFFWRIFHLLGVLYVQIRDASVDKVLESSILKMLREPGFPRVKNIYPLSIHTSVPRFPYLLSRLPRGPSCSYHHVAHVGPAWSSILLSQLISPKQPNRFSFSFPASLFIFYDYF